MTPTGQSAIFSQRPRSTIFNSEIKKMQNEIESYRESNLAIAVVIPCYKVSQHIESVVGNIDDYVSYIIVVDDACPENSGDLIADNFTDERIKIIKHLQNKGVGGATITGFKYALDLNVDYIIKIDGDGQMDSSLMPYFVKLLHDGSADYVKGNRFFDLEKIYQMPKLRIFGNACLSFINKFSSGYWNIFDPTNGYIAIHSSVAKHLPFDKIHNRYFFESDLLFRLNLLKANVIDLPIDANYNTEISNMSPIKEIPNFLLLHLRNFFKRIFYNYILRDFNIASIELFVGIFMIIFGSVYGMLNWSASSSEPATAGTVMLAGLPILIGTQLLLAFLSYDIQSTPRVPLHRILSRSAIRPKLAPSRKTR